MVDFRDVDKWLTRVSVCELKNPTMSAFLNGIESSGWLKHVKAVLDASVFIAKVHDVVAVRTSSVSWCNSFKFCN